MAAVTTDDLTAAPGGPAERALDAGPGGGAPAAEALNVLWPGPAEIMQGEIVELKVSGEGLAEVDGRLDKETVYFHPTSHGLFTAIVGADLESRPLQAPTSSTGSA